MKTTRLLPLLAALAVGAGEISKAVGAVYCVRTNGNDALSGNSWADARRTVAATIAIAIAGDEIWVARGSYPEHLTLKPDVALYGGFTGVETTRAQRDWTNELSILWGTTNKTVVNITNSGPATRLDGFTIGGGNGIHGGGIAMVGSGPVIANSTVRNNITDGAGSGISIWGFQLLSSTNAHFPIITNNIIAPNTSGIWRYPYLNYQPVLQNNCVHNSNANNYVNLAPRPRDIQADPRFASWAAANFQLRSNSPAIDGGTTTNAPAWDCDAMPRPLDGDIDGIAAVDMGAFEFVHPNGDTDRDGMFDMAELTAGTDPTNRGSELRANIGIVASSGRLAISWS